MADVMERLLNPPMFEEIITRPRVKPMDCTLTNLRRVAGSALGSGWRERLPSGMKSCVTHQNETRRPQWFSVGRKERRAVAMTQITLPTVTMSIRVFAT